MDYFYYTVVRVDTVVVAAPTGPSSKSLSLDSELTKELTGIVSTTLEMMCLRRGLCPHKDASVVEEGDTPELLHWRLRYPSTLTNRPVYARSLKLLPTLPTSMFGTRLL